MGLLEKPRIQRSDLSPTPSCFPKISFHPFNMSTCERLFSGNLVESLPHIGEILRLQVIGVLFLLISAGCGRSLPLVWRTRFGHFQSVRSAHPPPPTLSLAQDKLSQLHIFPLCPNRASVYCANCDSAREETVMRFSTTMPFCPSRFCWIRGRAVSTEHCEREEHQNVVHGEYYEAGKKIKEAGLAARARLIRGHAFWPDC